jgi:hypothetical protein
LIEELDIQCIARKSLLSFDHDYGAIIVPICLYISLPGDESKMHILVGMEQNLCNAKVWKPALIISMLVCEERSVFLVTF